MSAVQKEEQSLLERRPVERPKPAADVPRCAVLLAICNADGFLGPQLKSIEAQSYENIELYIGDDSDKPNHNLGVRNIRFRNNRPVRHSLGPRAGFAQNFRKLLENVDECSEFVAFCDQDDVWDDDKIARAIDALSKEKQGIPAAYCSRTLECDVELRPLGKSRMPKRPLGFSHALVQNVMAGNTIVLNRPAVNLLKIASKVSGPVPAHDWWVYQVISGCGGRILFDPKPSLKYRQHDRNAIGANRGIRAALSRIRHVFCGQYAGWIDENISALLAVRNFLSQDNQLSLDTFIAARRRWLVPRLMGLRRSGVYRQNMAETLALWIAAALGRV